MLGIETGNQLAEKELGNFVKQVIKDRGLSYRKIADEVPIDHKMVSQLANDGHIGAVKTLIAIADILGVRPGLLIDILAGKTGDAPAFTNSVALPSHFNEHDRADVERYIELLRAKKQVDAMGKNKDNQQPSQDVPDDGYERYPDGRMTPNGYMQYDKDMRAELAKQQGSVENKEKKENQTVNHQ